MCYLPCFLFFAKTCRGCQIWGRQIFVYEPFSWLKTPSFSQNFSWQNKCIFASCLSNVIFSRGELSGIVCWSLFAHRICQSLNITTDFQTFVYLELKGSDKSDARTKFFNFTKSMFHTTDFLFTQTLYFISISPSFAVQLQSQKPEFVRMRNGAWSHYHSGGWVLLLLQCSCLDLLTGLICSDASKGT